MLNRSVLIVGALLAAHPVHASTPDAAGKIRAAIGKAPGSQPGCAVGIFRNGAATEYVNVGLADVSTGKEIGSDTQFYAASVAKQFTAVAVMQQVVEGKVRLTDSVRKHIPEMPAYADAITVQMLLNMSSGVRDSLSLMGLEGYDLISVPTRQQAFNAVYRQKEPKFTPGTQYDYTNGGYLLLSEIVERSSGIAFETYINKRVLAPLGMTRSNVMSGQRNTDANIAKGYIAENGNVRLADEYPLFGGSGGLITTINDLGRWNHDIDAGHKVWTPAITRLMAEPGKFLNGTPVIRTGRGIAYGNALIIGSHWFHHTGGAGGFKTLFGHLREKRMGFAMLCNNGAIDPAPKADEIVAALGENLPAILEATADGTALDGRYQNPNVSATYHIKVSGDYLEVTIARPDGSRTAPKILKRSDDGQFSNGQMQLKPDDDARGFTVEIPRVTLHFERAS